jgi:hypothetical protein
MRTPSAATAVEHVVNGHFRHGFDAYRGFTLFEVALSLALMSFAVISVLMIFPTGLQHQQQARFRLLASAKALEVIEFFSGKLSSERVADFETPEPWEARPFCYTSTRWDLEARLARFDAGIRPLPLAIARRLDSDGDEIQRLLDEGAYLYYADPAMIPGIDMRMRNPSPPVESTKVVFAVSGHAQNNAVPVFPWKAWPYRAAYPSPPLYAGFGGGQLRPSVVVQGSSTNWHLIEGWTGVGADPAAPGARDPLLTTVFNATVEYTRSITVNPVTGLATLAPKRKALADATLAYAREAFRLAGADLEFDQYITAAGASDFISLGRQWDAEFAKLCSDAEALPVAAPDSARERQRSDIARRVQALRFLALATATFYQRRQTDAVEPDLSTELLGTIPLSVDRLRYYHDRCKAFAMRYAASFPNDWSAPRPQSRSIMMDYPLIEFDLFSPPRRGTIAGSGAAAAMWRPLSSGRITGIGLPGVFPGTLDGTAWDNTRSPFAGIDARDGSHRLWGDARHFTLTQPFHPTERCRQLVFWSVDWHSYTDAETAPAAPLDASRAPCDGPRSTTLGNYDARLNGGLPAEDGLHLRNPERAISFRQDVSSVATGADVTGMLVGASLGSDTGGGSRTVLLGIHGADRNRNDRLDRGPLPAAVRMRATQVARFNFYDPRLPITLR